jgi:hypothetical protein
MTIFHVLKYPISDSPTEDAINALPSDLYKKWIGHLLAAPLYSPKNIALLRKLIAEYEE